MNNHLLNADPRRPTERRESVIDDPVLPPDQDPDIVPDVREPADEPTPPPIDLPPRETDSPAAI